MAVGAFPRSSGTVDGVVEREVCMLSCSSRDDSLEELLDGEVKAERKVGLTVLSQMTVAEKVGTSEGSRESASLVRSDIPSACEGLKDWWVCIYYKMTEHDVNKSP